MTRFDDPIDHLLEEHMLILGRADELGRAMARLQTSGLEGLAGEQEQMVGA